MIEKLDIVEATDNIFDRNGFLVNVPSGAFVVNKINEIIDYINHSNHEYESIEDVVKSNDTGNKFVFTIKYLKEELDQMKEALYDAKYALEEVIQPSEISHEQELAQKALDTINNLIKTRINND